MTTERKRCFVIMPFSETTEKHTKDYWTRHYDSYLKPLIEEIPGLEAKRSEPLRGGIVGQIITDLVTCPVVVANLTDHNANVYWELGVRNSFKHGSVTIAEYGTKIPFDVGGQGALFYYPNDSIEDLKFCGKFKEALKDCLAHPERPDSHVLEAISGRGTLFEVFRRDETTRRLEAVISECETNVRVFSECIDAAKRNMALRVTKQKKDVSFPRRIPRTTALELLITNRYVDRERSFYKEAENLYDLIEIMADACQSWSHSSEKEEELFLKFEQRLPKVVEDFLVKLRAVLQEVSGKY